MRAKSTILKWRGPNDGTRTLLESVLVPEVAAAMYDWTKNAPSDYVIIGGAALSYYTKPRYTEDVDVLVKSADEFGYAEGFKKHRASALEHKKTGVEIELLYPGHVDISPQLVQQVFDTSFVLASGERVASPAGIVATKLGRAMGSSLKAQQDRVDIGALIEYEPSMTMDAFDIPDEQRELFNQIKAAVQAPT